MTLLLLAWLASSALCYGWMVAYILHEWPLGLTWEERRSLIFLSLLGPIGIYAADCAAQETTEEHIWAHGWRVW